MAIEKTMKTGERAHALLGASSAYRWLACTKSARLAEKFPNESSEAAEEGTCAHAFCEKYLNEALGRKTEPIDKELIDKYYNPEMDEHARNYADFVLSVRDELVDPLVLVEAKVTYDKWVEEGFGTADAIVVDDEKMVVCDFKYGQGVKVEVEENPQLKLYALGAYELVQRLFDSDVKDVEMVVYQPRMKNVSRWSTTVEALLEWAENYVAPRAKLAWEDKGEFVPGSHCRFCPAKAVCTARAEDKLLFLVDVMNEAVMTPEQIAKVLTVIPDIKTWISSIEEGALKAALDGTVIPGYSVVTGKGNSKFSDEEAVTRTAEALGFEPYEKKLLSPAAMKKLVGNAVFKDAFQPFVYRPEGSPKLVADAKD